MLESSNKAAIQLLRSWRKGDEKEQRETLECLDLEEDIIMTFPPPKTYTIKLTISKITKGKLRFID